MHRLIAEKAGHRAIAGMMSFVDHSDYEDDGLGRLQASERPKQIFVPCSQHPPQCM